MIVTLEGIDGAGKRTLAQAILRVAARNEIDAKAISFPRYGQSVTSAAISALLASHPERSQASARFTAALFAAERLEALPLLIEWSSPGRLLLIDRYVHSNMAYQGARTDQSPTELANWVEVLEFEVFGVPRPDVIVLIDVDTETSMERTGKRSVEAGRLIDDAYERDRTLLEAARSLYLEMYREQRGGNWVLAHTVGTTKSPELIAEEVWNQHISGFLTSPAR